LCILSSLVVPLGTIPGLLYASVPPLVGSVAAHGLLGDLRAYEVSSCSLACRQEVVVGLCFSFEDVEFEVFPEGGLNEWKDSSGSTLKHLREQMVAATPEADAPGT
jgi:hypothetical protein